MGRSKRKLENVEEYNVPDPASASAVTPTTRTQVHSEYASGQAARHWTISTPILELFTAPASSPSQTESPDVTDSDPAIDTLDWSQANSDISAHIEADVELTEMKDCELEALGLKQFLTEGDKKSRIPSEKTSQNFTPSRSVSGFFLLSIYFSSDGSRTTRFIFGPPT